MQREARVVVNQEMENWPDFVRLLSTNDRHGMALRKFCELHQLPISLDWDGFNGHLWAQAIASLGHAVIQVDDWILVYLPCFLDRHQYQWFQATRPYFSKNRDVVSYFSYDLDPITGEIQKTIEKVEDEYGRTAYQKLYKVIKKKYQRGIENDGTEIRNRY